MNYDETLEYIHKVSWTGSRPGLSRIYRLLDMLGNPQDSLRFIHVAGTNGKGSFCAMTDNVLRVAGYKTGLYTSPYMERFNERIVIDGQPISDEELAEITTNVRTFADKLTDPPTEFELITAVAMVCFARHNCDPVVLEVGMGGRLDATNIIKTPILSVITGISLDHTMVLGDTVQQIAEEKAGIIKSIAPVLYGGTDAAAGSTIRGISVLCGADYSITEHGKIRILECNLNGTAFTYKDGIYRINLLGLYQPKNAATVIEAIRILRERGFNISEQALNTGLSTTVWHGRFEKLCLDPLFIFDGSHNPEAVFVAVDSIKQYFGIRKVILLTGVLHDKDFSRMAASISTVTDRAFTLTPGNPRALDAKQYAAEFHRNGVRAESSETIPEAVKKAVIAAKESGLPIVALGSLYMYADVKQALKELNIM